MLNKFLKRIRNKKVILAVVSGILMILLDLEIITEVVSNDLLELTNTFLSIGVAIGIFSNPESHIK